MNRKSDELNRLGVICRICLKKDGPMSSIFTKNENNDVQAILATSITSIARVEVNPGDGLPASICESCRNQIEKFNDFRLLIEISDRALRSYLADSQQMQKTCVRSEEMKDLGHQTTPMENDATEDSGELFAVNTILVPSVSGNEVWRICSVEGGEYNEYQASDSAEHRTNFRDLDTEIQNELSRKVTQIQNTKGEQSLFFTTINSEDGEGATSESEQLTCLTIMNEENNEEPGSSLLPLDKYSCQLCLKPFGSLRTLKSHVKDHFLGGTERIQICEMDKKNVRLSRRLKNFNRKPRSKRIKEIPDGDGARYPAICPLCKRVFESEAELLHAKITNRKTTTDGRNMENDEESCRNCGNKMTKRSNDEQVGHEDSSLTCTICNKHFRNAQSHKLHLKRHTLGSRFNCLECGKSYYSNSELARHTRSHTGMREYSCRLCEMSFFSKPELNRHTKYHNGEKKFQCKICFKSYYESGHLKVHERAHTGEKPFACSICDKAFITKSKLMRHCKIHEKHRACLMVQCEN